MTQNELDAKSLENAKRLFESGEINTRRTEDRDLLLAVKEGLWFSEDAEGNRSFAPEFWEMLDKMEERFEYAKENSVLPDKPDEERAFEIMIEAHRKIVAG